MTPTHHEQGHSTDILQTSSTLYPSLRSMHVSYTKHNNSTKGLANVKVTATYAQGQGQGQGRGSKNFSFLIILTYIRDV